MQPDKLLIVNERTGMEISTLTGLFIDHIFLLVISYVIVININEVCFNFIKKLIILYALIL